jgi:hypothetical protein
MKTLYFLFTLRDALAMTEWYVVIREHILQQLFGDVYFNTLLDNLGLLPEQ